MYRNFQIWPNFGYLCSIFGGGILLLHFKIIRLHISCEDSPKKNRACIDSYDISTKWNPAKTPQFCRGGNCHPPLISSPLAWLPTRGRYLAPSESLPSPSLHLAPLKGLKNPRSTRGKTVENRKTPQKKIGEQIVAGFDSRFVFHFYRCLLNHNQNNQNKLNTVENHLH